MSANECVRERVRVRVRERVRVRMRMCARVCACVCVCKRVCACACVRVTAQGRRRDAAKTVEGTRRDAAERRPYVVPEVVLIRAFSNAARNDGRDVRGTADCAVPARFLR